MHLDEMSYDKNGIGFIDISNNISLLHQNFDEFDYEKGKKIPLKSNFYQLPSTADYLLKIAKQHAHHDEIMIYQMVEKLLKVQSNIPLIEFPIGYVTDDLNIIGQIIRYYLKAISLKSLCIKHNLQSLQEYIYLDDDPMHNLFLVYLEILYQLQILFDNGISYLDVHAGNFVILENKVQIIDFDHDFIEFSKIRYYQIIILREYLKMIHKVSMHFGINLSADWDNEYSFDAIRNKVKMMENRARRI